MTEGAAFIVGDLRRGSDANRWTRSTRNPGMARFSRLRSVEGRTGSRGSAAATVVASCTSGSGRKSALYSHYALPEHDPLKDTTALPRQPGDGAAHQESGSLERAGHGHSREQDPGRYWRAHFHVCFGGHPL